MKDINLMTRKEYIIYDINQNADIMSRNYKFQLDNLDWVRLVRLGGWNDTPQRIVVENEHGTVYELDLLSCADLELVLSELGIEPRFDYIMVDEADNWLHVEAQTTQADIDAKVEDFGKKTCEGNGIIVYTAKELIRKDYKY